MFVSLATISGGAGDVYLRVYLLVAWVAAVVRRVPSLATSGCAHNVRSIFSLIIGHKHAIVRFY